MVTLISLPLGAGLFLDLTIYIANLAYFAMLLLVAELSLQSTINMKLLLRDSNYHTTCCDTSIWIDM